jgi:hypothetical protein
MYLNAQKRLRDLLKLTNIFGVYKPQITSLLTFIIEWKVKFRLEFSENKVVNFPHPNS